MALESKQVAAALANYVIALANAADTTKRAEDRAVYAKLLADGGVLLAMATRGDPEAALLEAVAKHQRT
ncbi:hypothetical protein BWI17_00665 [Betaproteobacteria bacterium GR16-43]|nr:hypothetical protein BWI17_00665 [Betaproteobacteria bacterium GR16-43]